LEPRASDEVFHGALLRLVVETWGRSLREIVHHPGAAAMVALDGSEVVLVRQLREAVRSHTLEIPAGILDREGESSQECAVRELREEAGYSAREVKLLGVVHPSPGFSDERIDIFMCRAEAEGQPEEGIELVPMPLSHALQGIRDGWITDGKTVAGLLLAADRGR
jgi:ADP-ribose pyrophosphatase